MQDFTEEPFSPQQILDAGHQAELAGRFDHADQFYRYLVDMMPAAPEAASARARMETLATRLHSGALSHGAQALAAGTVQGAAVGADGGGHHPTRATSPLQQGPLAHASAGVSPLPLPPTGTMRGPPGPSMQGGPPTRGPGGSAHPPIAGSSPSSPPSVAAGAGPFGAGHQGGGYQPGHGGAPAQTAAHGYVLPQGGVHSQTGHGGGSVRATGASPGAGPGAGPGVGPHGDHGPAVGMHGSASGHQPSQTTHGGERVWVDPAMRTFPPQTAPRGSAAPANLTRPAPVEQPVERRSAGDRTGEGALRRPVASALASSPARLPSALLLPRLQRGYRSARLLCSLIGVVGAVLVVAGMLVTLAGLIGPLGRLFPVLGQLAAAVGLYIGPAAVVLGTMLLLVSQVAKAAFDSADALRDLSAIERAKAAYMAGSPLADPEDEI